MTRGLVKSRAVAGWLAVGMCASVAVLTWFGYRAIRGWQASAALLVERRASEAASLLVTALTHDMHAVQRSVLLTVDWSLFLQDAPYDVSGIVANAFARYPYPEAFFAAGGDLRPGAFWFFTRSNRPPAWAAAGREPMRYPVTVLREPRVAGRLLEAIGRDAPLGRRFAIFQIALDGVEYQVVAILRYAGPFRERVEDVFGFMVNLAWARDHYFPEVTSQVARMAGSPGGLALSLVDGRGRRVATTHPSVSSRAVSRHALAVMFFDPVLAAVGQSRALAREEWFVEVSGAPDPAFGVGMDGADRTLFLAGLAAASLALGLAMTARAVSANGRLAELRAEFVSSVTHELKTPISTIRAVGDTLASGRVHTRAGQRDYAQIVVQEAKRLTRLVDNLLALSRMTDVTEVYWFEPLSVEALVEKTLRDFAPQIAAAGVEATVDIPAALPPVRGDRTALGLMLDNLVDNAIRYSPVRPRVALAARQIGAGVRLSVADNGIGIPADQIAHVTRKFFRGGTLVSNGSGLGLAIVKRVVADHAGRLTIDSTVDVGTTVSVTLPIARTNHEADTGR